MIKVLDLFAGTQSVRKALDKKYNDGNSTWGHPYIYGKNREVIGEHKHIHRLSHDGNNDFESMTQVEYIGVDIYSPEDENLILDLTKDNIIEELLKKLPEGWKPDFIWASPLCTPFSRATCIPKGTLSYIVENEVLRIRDDFSYITHKAYVKHKDNKEFQDKHIETGKIGLKLFENTKKIINYFNVPFAIENPAYAVSKYILKEYVKNDTAYCMYGFDYKKPTAIYSSKKLELKKCSHKNHKKVMSGNPTKTGIAATSSCNKERSKVPEELIESILEQLLGKEK